VTHPDPTADELIAVVKSCADELDRRMREASVKLEAAALALAEIPRLRIEVNDIAHEMRSLRTAISAINDVQDAAAAAPKGRPR
jgi:hypothetical protein